MYISKYTEPVAKLHELLVIVVLKIKMESLNNFKSLRVFSAI